jgi:hypothetical protein
MHTAKFRALASELWTYVNKEKLSISEGLSILREKHKLSAFALGHIQSVYLTSPLFRSMTRIHDRKKAA